MAENTNLIEYYKNLLIMQYNQSPKAISTIDSFVKALMIFDVLISVRDGFDINTSVGDQLDLVALYVGTSRYVPGTSFYREYFGYSLYGDVFPFAFNGYMKYDDAIPDIQFRKYEESKNSDYALTDEELRKFIKLRIIKNSSVGSLKDLDDFLLYFFNGEAYVEEESLMTINYYVPQSDLRIFNIAKETNVLPSPSGVNVFVTAI